MLQKIKNPNDVKKLDIVGLKLLAKDVRKRIIDVTHKNGGHLASSLGATDLAVALCKVFNPLNDRIVWDVGHQAYAFKILTERNDKFDTLRQYNGIGGFNDPCESPYDAFKVGHSATSISAALGILLGMEQNNKKHKAIAVIGDGALTGGMAFEALNHAGHMQKNLIVILNDNEMSISPNVGALQKYLTNMIVSKPYNQLKKQVWDLSGKLPIDLRKKFIYGARKIEGSIKNILVPHIFFEDLGFRYFGPVDGHDMQRLVRVLNRIKTIDGPILLHLVTQKGKGYAEAENNAQKYHGIAPYVSKTIDEKKQKNPSYSKVFGNKLCEIAAKNKKVSAIVAAMCDGTGLTDFARKFPKRFFDVGIAEQHAVTMAAGMAIAGSKPFVAIYSTFMQRALDQVIHDIALQNLPVVICMDRAGLVGEDGPTHHGAFDLSFLNYIPGLTVMAPSNATDLEKMLDFAASYTEGPIAIRYPRGSAVTGFETSSIEHGKSRIVFKGKKVAFLGLGNGYNVAKKVYKTFTENHPDLKPCLVDSRFLKPLDTKLLDEIAENCDTVFTFEENSIIGGFGSTVKAYLDEKNVKTKIFGLPDRFIPQGKTELILKNAGFTAEQIYPIVCTELKLKWTINKIR